MPRRKSEWPHIGAAVLIDDMVHRVSYANYFDTLEIRRPGWHFRTTCDAMYGRPRPRSSAKYTNLPVNCMLCLARGELDVATDSEGISHRVWAVYSQRISRCQASGGKLISFKGQNLNTGVVTCLACIGLIEDS